jgi:Transposase DDE domain group 1
LSRSTEVRKLLSRLVGRIRRHWPDTHIIFRGDGHYGREEAMTWCEANGVDYIFGLPGNVVLDRLVEQPRQKAVGGLAGKGRCRTPTVCTENFIRIDWLMESPNVSGRCWRCYPLSWPF